MVCVRSILFPESVAIATNSTACSFKHYVIAIVTDWVSSQAKPARLSCAPHSEYRVETRGKEVGRPRPDETTAAL